jgi:phosphohistidine phosphatase
MRLTLLRHGQAVDREEWQGDDPSRPLTKTGQAETQQVCKLLRKLVKAGEIWTSPWLRARQTAEIASDVWKLPLREFDWLAGGALSAAERAARLQPHTDVVLVGHEPDFGELARFLCGAQLELKKSGLVVLKGDPRQGAMALRCLLSPKMALGLAGED